MKCKRRIHGLTLPFMAIILAGLMSAAASAADLGEKIATQGNGSGAMACVGCHGADGSGVGAAGFPRLAGLNAEYLAAQLEAFRSGTRDNPVMAPVAKALSVDEAKAVAGYYAALKSASTAKADAKANIEMGKSLGRLGSWPDRQIPACEQCHGPDGTGIGASFPALAAQHPAYIKAQLMQWREGKRKNDPDALMTGVAARLTEAEIDAVANYYGSLPYVADPSTLPIRDITNIKPVPLVENEAMKKYFTPPAHGDYPKGEFGEAVKRGEAIYNQTSTHEVSRDYVGNDQQCANCHMDAGRLAGAAPMWASWPVYPAYRKKNKKVNDMTMRVQGCFTYSMNAQGSKMGKAPSNDSDVITDLMAYMFWMSQGTVTGETKMAGRGFPKFAMTKKGYDPKRGKKVFEAHCATCHGDNGQGVVRADGKTLFPPLWGAGAYNWGAGMHQVDKAAFFIKANMPLGKPNSLTEQQAWDVAAYINSHERPQDPRFTGNLKETQQKFHKKHKDYYGRLKTPEGKLLGEASPTHK